MKKIIIMLSTMNTTGGVWNTACNLMKAIDKNQYEVVFTQFRQKDRVTECLPAGVRFLPLNLEDTIYDELTLSNCALIKKFFKQFKFIRIFKVFGVKFLNKFFLRKTPISIFHSRYYDKKVKPLKEQFDLALDFSGHARFNTWFVANKICAPVKATWIHCNYGYLGINPNILKKEYMKYDRIFGVSHSVCDTFKKLIPDLSYKVEVLHNLIDTEKIKKLAEEENPFREKCFKILTVGSGTYLKGIDTAVKVCVRLKGKQIKWYWIGKYDQGLVKIIEQYNISDKFKLLGPTNNPYKYMKNCDLYIQPSKSEGYGMAVLEAKSLSRPIIVGNVPGILEVFGEGDNPVVCSLMNMEQEIYENILKLWQTPSLSSEFVYPSNNTLRCDLEKIYHLIKGNC